MRIWDWIHERVEHLYDPYQNPGQDLIVDETYHHIDHGLGVADFGHDFDHGFDHGFDHDFGHDFDHGFDHDFGHDFGGMDGF